jgi:hypothetical protein
MQQLWATADATTVAGCRLQKVTPHDTIFSAANQTSNIKSGIRLSAPTQIGNEMLRVPPSQDFSCAGNCGQLLETAAVAGCRRQITTEHNFRAANLTTSMMQTSHASSIHGCCKANHLAGQQVECRVANHPKG